MRRALTKEEPSLGASLSSAKKEQNEGKPGHIESPNTGAEVIPIHGESAPLGKAVPSWESADLVPEGGLEPPRG